MREAGGQAGHGGLFRVGQAQQPGCLPDILFAESGVGQGGPNAKFAGCPAAGAVVAGIIALAAVSHLGQALAPGQGQDAAHDHALAQVAAFGRVPGQAGFEKIIPSDQPVPQMQKPRQSKGLSLLGLGDER